MRDAVFGWEGLTDLVHLGALLVFAGVMWRVAIVGMRRKLVD